MLYVHGHTKPHRHLLSLTGDMALEAKKKAALLMVWTKAIWSSGLIARFDFSWYRAYISYYIYFLVFFFNEQTEALVFSEVKVNFPCIATIYIFTTKKKSKSFLQSPVTYVRDQNPDMNFDLPSCMTDACLSEMLSSDMTTARRSLI